MNQQRMFQFCLVGLGVVVALAALGVPVLAYLPFLLLLACPLMMFMHGGHGGHGEHGGHGGHGAHGDTRRDADRK